MDKEYNRKEFLIELYEYTKTIGKYFLLVGVGSLFAGCSQQPARSIGTQPSPQEPELLPPPAYVDVFNTRISNGEVDVGIGPPFIITLPIDPLLQKELNEIDHYQMGIYKKDGDNYNFVMIHQIKPDPDIILGKYYHTHISPQGLEKKVDGGPDIEYKFSVNCVRKNGQRSRSIEVDVINP